MGAAVDKVVGREEVVAAAMVVASPAVTKSMPERIRHRRLRSSFSWRSGRVAWIDGVHARQRCRWPARSFGAATAEETAVDSKSFSIYFGLKSVS